jgi:Kdo2-lipid IVA lauroyltransferase/acyltransferase
MRPSLNLNSYLCTMLLWFLSILLKGLGKLPWIFWNGVGSGLYFLLATVLRYRYVVITDNLEKSFPNKNPQQIDLLRKAFYRHLCDLMIETIRSFSFTQKEVEDSVIIRENDCIRGIISGSENAILLFGHYHNWEYITQICGIYFSRKNHQKTIGFFKTIRNKTVEELLNSNRTRFGGEMFSDKQPKSVIKLLQGKEKIILGMVADQTPPGREQMFLLDFLGRPTPFFTGPGWIAAAAKVPVYYGRVNRLNRHQYEVIPELLYLPDSTDSRQEVIRKVTEMYALKLEEQIKEHPEFWLWSHRRWKYAPN